MTEEIEKIEGGFPPSYLAERPKPKSRNKYRPGDFIQTVHELIDTVFNKREYIYIGHKPQHPGWVMSLQLRSIMLGLNSLTYRRAIKNKEDDNDQGNGNGENRGKAAHGPHRS